MDKKELKNRLTKEEFAITQEKGTEAPFTGKYLDNKDEAYINVFAADKSYSHRPTNMILNLDGLASMMFYTKKMLS